MHARRGCVRGPEHRRVPPLLRLDLDTLWRLAAERLVRLRMGSERRAAEGRSLRCAGYRRPGSLAARSVPRRLVEPVSGVCRVYCGGGFMPTLAFEPAAGENGVVFA